MIKTARIATGKARAEGRQPSHDGEYITIYYKPGNAGTIIAGHNAGTFSLETEGLDDEGIPEADQEALREEWDGIRTEAYEIVHEDKGAAIQMQYSVGRSVKSEMICLGWASVEDFDDDHYIKGAA